MKNIILQIQEEFLKALQEKNSWGKNEVHLLYLSVCTKVLSDKVVNVEDIKSVPSDTKSSVLSDFSSDEKPF